MSEVGDMIRDEGLPYLAKNAELNERYGSMTIYQSYQKHADDDAEIERLREALNRVLEYEQMRASLNGYSDCSCINYSRQMEQAYENGLCPHQVARRLL